MVSDGRILLTIVPGILGTNSYSVLRIKNTTNGGCSEGLGAFRFFFKNPFGEEPVQMP